MDDNDLRLDGNAAGGLLNEVFPFEMKAATTICSGCGAMKHLHHVGKRGLSVCGCRGARMVARATASHAGEEEENIWQI